MSQKIFLIGLPGAGKTTMGLELGLHLTFPFIDLDQEIERETGQTITEIFSDKGEAHFRQLERLQLEKIIDTFPSFILATGGGTPSFFDNMEKMNEAGTTVFINTPIDKIKERLAKDTTRPLMKSNDLENLFLKRKSFYLNANHSINTLDKLIELF